MLEPQMPDDEDDRLATLQALRILDTAPEERFDRLTRMAKRLFGVPISLVSLIDSDRQWFKSKQGLEAPETPRNISFCGHAILGDDIFLIPDAAEDERFSDNPLVTDAPHIRFYAGCPLKSANGQKMGTLCLIDEKPRELSDEDKQLLRDLAVMAQQELAAIELATMDDLTGISNRRGFMSLAQHAIKMCDRMAWPAAFIMFDLDEFKPINDQFGHAEGDRALKAFARILKTQFRESDVFARIGGDEFVAILTGTGTDMVESALRRFQESIDQYNKESKRGYDIMYSAGYAIRDRDDSESLETMLALADSQMYENKMQKQVI